MVRAHAGEPILPKPVNATELTGVVYSTRSHIMTRTIINQVRELLDRNLDAQQIAQALHMNFDTVMQAIQVIQNC